MSQEKVLIDYFAVETTSDNQNASQRIAKITLNKPKALNALDLDMVKQMQAYLELCKSDDSVRAVIIDSEGEKAFCAGGDIVSMYKAMASTDDNSEGDLPAFLASFFAEEYRLDYAIHVYPKPIICWGNGIIMGGGLGVFSGASHKIVTESARIAMPEITIGLFPDVGASYFLNKLPQGVGQFLGLTAASINAKDCVQTGLANYFLLHEQKPSFINELCRLENFHKDNISKLCSRFTHAEMTQSAFDNMHGNIESFMSSLIPLANMNELSSLSSYLHKLAQDFPDNRVLSKGVSAFTQGSPITAHLVVSQLQRSKMYNLAECFRMELSMAYQCSILGEFQEGVRALLIDKDNSPNWQYKTFEDVPDDVINKHFSYFENRALSHPLSDLEIRYGEHHG